MMDIEKKPYAPKVVSIFSGCGGLDYGFHMEGYETVWANELNRLLQILEMSLSYPISQK